MVALLLLAVCLGPLISACARFQPRPVSPSQTLSAFEDRQLSDPALRAFIETNLGTSLPAWPLTKWDLTNLTVAAFYFHPDLELARAKWAVANAASLTAGERPNPTLSVTPAYNTTTTIPSPWLVTPTLDVPIETAGKRAHRLDQAKRLAAAARLNIASAAWQVRSRVRRALLDLYSAQQNQRLLQEQQSLQDENVRLLQGQYAAGAISAFELTQARLAAHNARFALIDAQRLSIEARSRLAEAVGVPVRNVEDLEFSFQVFNALPPELPAAEARRQALLTRPDILACLAEYSAVEAGLQLEISKQYPDVHLAPGYEFDQGDNKWSLGLTVTLPVLNQNKGPIAEATARRSQAAAAFNAVQARVLAEVDLAIALYRVSLQKTAELQALVSDLQNQEKSAQAMLAAGAISRAELAALQLQLSATALARQDAINRAQQALGQLEDALQRPMISLPASAWELAPGGAASGQSSP